jgi:NTE family protein
MSIEDLRRGVAAFLPDIDLAETRIPFIVTAVDMLTGCAARLRRGPIIEAVMASCAMPGYMPPVPMGDALRMDGGLAALIPAAAARAGGAEIVVGVDVGIEHVDACRIASGVDAIDRALDIMSYHLGDAGRQACDLVIEPLDGHVAWTDFDSYRELVRQGQAAVEVRQPELAALLGDRAAA